MVYMMLWVHLILFSLFGLSTAQCIISLVISLPRAVACVLWDSSFPCAHFDSQIRAAFAYSYLWQSESSLPWLVFLSKFIFVVSFSLVPFFVKRLSVDCIGAGHTANHLCFLRGKN